MRPFPRPETIEDDLFSNTPQPQAAPSHRVRAGATITAVALGMVTAAPGVAVAAERYKVQAGDTLATIAEDFGYKGEDAWRRLYNANEKVDNPDLIVPGQKLTIPERGERVKSRPLPEATQAATTTSSSAVSTADTSSAPSGGVWYELANCESGGNWATNTGNGYYGGLQFSLSSWQAVGGSGYPHEASAATQIAMAQRLQASQGWGAWPGCAAQLGLL
jgi:LysM repeat protein